MLDDEIWRLVFGMPIVFNCFTLLMVIYYFKELSIIDLLEDDKD